VSDPQVVRALALLMEMARSRRGVLIKAFAEKRNYPKRGVYRARDTLIEAGAPIRKNPDSPARWQLMDGWLPPSVIGAAKEELMSLFVARHFAPGLRGTAVGRALDTLWSKLASPTPQQALPLAEPLPFSIRTLPAIDYGHHQFTIDALETAIAKRHAVRICYQTPDSAITERVIEPGFLHWDGGLEAMYVPSWCRLRDAIRVFAVHRIRSIEALPDEPARAVPAKRMERAFRVWYRDEIEHVHVLFTPRLAGEIRERRWHASQRLVEAPDGGVHLHLDVSAPDELVRWLVGFGAGARVIEPVSLAERIRQVHVTAAGVGQVIEAAMPRKSRERRPAGAAVIAPRVTRARRRT
jgi:predicted DNA-binding transcriptional regulator YafY